MTTVRDHVAIACLGSLLACAPSRGSVESNARPSARFRDLPDVVLADSGEGRPIPGLGHIRYPDEERRRDVEAAFAFVFVLDTAGRVEYETVSFLGAAPQAFLSEACMWLRSERFVPIRRGGNLQRALVVSDLSFTLERSELRGGGNPVTSAPVVNTEKLRRELAAKGVAEAARELEPRRHCA